jgi:hypothetical protein
VLQRRPDDADVQAALKQIEDKASNAAVQAAAPSRRRWPSVSDTTKTAQKGARADGGNG